MTDPSAHSPQRRLLALLFADAVGYSRLMAHDEAATLTRLEECVRLFRRLIVDYGGRIVEVTGDEVYAVFDSALEALRFAVEIQGELRNRQAWLVGEEPILFRIGIHSGEVLVADDRVHGHHVNVTARIQTVAPVGGICISSAVQAVLGPDAGFRTRSIGQRMLKNLPEPYELFVVDLDGDEPSGMFELASPPQPLALWTATPEPKPIEPPPRCEIGLAVLPFDNLSQDPIDEHLCAGFVADIITNLTRFREIAVIARHSAFLFKGSTLTVEQIARNLGVRYLVQGSLQRIGIQLRLRVHLVEGENGRTIWSEHYDGDMRDIFAFQDDFTALTAARLAVQISAAERQRLEERHTPVPFAYGLILRGYDLSFRHRQEATLHARRLFEEATKLDPEYGRSYAGMSRTFNLAWRYRWADNPEACLDKAVELARAAADHDPFDARGFAELGFALLYRKENEASLNAYAHAVDLNPNDADILVEYSDALSYAGSYDPALGHLGRAMHLNPYVPDWYYWVLGDVHFHRGDYAAAVEALKKMRDPTEGSRLLAASYAQLGELELARHHAQLVLKKHPGFSLDHWKTITPNRNQAVIERFIEGLRKAGLR